MSHDQPELELDLLHTADTIVIVGVSRSATADSHIVANHLQRNGYRIIPVHPAAETILGEPAYPAIPEIPKALAADVDLVNIWRPSDEVPGIVNDAVNHLPNLGGVWTQKNIRSDSAADTARTHGVDVVQDRCIRTQHLFGKFAGATPRSEA